MTEFVIEYRCSIGYHPSHTERHNGGDIPPRECKRCGRGMMALHRPAREGE